MTTTKIKCGACGFGALLFRAGESTKLTVDSARQTHVCNHLKHQPRSIIRRVGPLDCRDFREAVERPTQNNKAGSPTLDDETESEAVEVKHAAPERASNSTPARVGRSRRAEGAETEAGSSKAKSARRPRKSTSRRSAHSDVATVSDCAPTVS